MPRGGDTTQIGFIFILFVLAGAVPLAHAENTPPSSQENPAAQSQAAEQNWARYAYSNSIGYEGAYNTGMLPQNMITYGHWDREWGFELMVGFNKSSDNFTETDTTGGDGVLRTNQSATTAYNNSKNPYVFSVAVMPMVNVFKNQWIRIYAGALLAEMFTTGYQYPTGSQTITTPNPNLAGYQNIYDSNFGTVNGDPYFSTVIGPRIGSEFYIKWFPHLAIGFAAAILTTITGDQTRTTATSTGSYPVINGVSQGLSSVNNSTVVSRVEPGVSGATIGIGGTSFNLFGTFTIRYIW